MVPYGAFPLSKEEGFTMATQVFSWRCCPGGRVSLAVDSWAGPSLRFLSDGKDRDWPADTNDYRYTHGGRAYQRAFDTAPQEALDAVAAWRGSL